MKFLKIFLCLFSSIQIQAFRTSSFSIEVDFRNYINKSEKDLISDTNVNWVRTDYYNAYVCQQERVKDGKDLLALLPRMGEFMSTYVYARPGPSQKLYADLITYPLRMPTNNGYVDFNYSLDKHTGLRVYLWTKRNGIKNKKLIWEKVTDSRTKGIQWAQAPIRDTLSDEFRLIFTAKVKADYPYKFRTYLSQVVIDKVFINSSN